MYFFVFLGEQQPPLCLCCNSFCCCPCSCFFSLLLLPLSLLLLLLRLLLRVTYKQFACFKNALDMALCSAFGFAFALALPFGFDSRRQLRLDLAWPGLAWPRVESGGVCGDCVLGAARCWGTYLSAYLKINVNSFIYFLCQIKRFKGYMQDNPSWASSILLLLPILLLLCNGCCVDQSRSHIKRSGCCKIIHLMDCAVGILQVMAAASSLG